MVATSLSWRHGRVGLVSNTSVSVKEEQRGKTSFELSPRKVVPGLRSLRPVIV